MSALEKAGKRVSQGYVCRIIREFDEDHNGELDFNEFRKMVECIELGEFDGYNSDEEINGYKIR